MKFYTYILSSEKSNKYYVGQTNDLNLRLSSHNEGRVKSTKFGRTWAIIWYTTCESRKESVNLEKKIKNMGSKRFLVGKKLLIP